MKKDLVTLSELSRADFTQIFSTAADIKDKTKKGEKFAPLAGKTLAMIFTKPSTRTRVSFEAGIYQLGGQGLFLSGQELQLRRGETIGDTAKTLSRYVHGIMIRTFSHKDVTDLAQFATIPVINGLTDQEHPCQVLGDLLTIMEHRKFNFANLQVVFMGDGNNVANSWIQAGAILGIKFNLCCPKGYEPDKEILKWGLEQAGKTGAQITVSHDPQAAAEGADVVYTDVWASMGKDEEKDKRVEIFKPFQVNEELVKKAKPDCFVMHCLPAHRGEEITDEVVDGPHSIVFDQAENRLHIQKAIMYLLMKDKK